MVRMDDQQLKALYGQVNRKKQLEAQRESLRAQYTHWELQANAYEKQRMREDADVERLEGGSLAAFFYRTFGRFDEKLTKEREEAYAAAVKHDAAVREKDAVEAELCRCEEELAALAGCEARYHEAMEEKAEALRASGGEKATEFLQAEEAVFRAENQRREVNEALAAGERAMETVDSVLVKLDDAEGWGMWDVMGGDFLTDLFKHDALDEAQELVGQLQRELSRFGTELADVSMVLDEAVNIDGFMLFADYFFDGLFADWAVLDQIGQSKERIEQTRDRIVQLLERLKAMRQQAEAEQKEAEKARETLLLGLEI